MRAYYAVTQRPGSRWDPTKPVREQALWDEHARHIDALFDRGAIVLAGPFADRSGSMLVVRAADAGAARAYFTEDPWSVDDILVVADVKEWTIFLDDAERERRDPTPSAVLFVADVAGMSRFYRELAGMTTLVEQSDHVVLEIDGLQLVIHALRNETPVDPANRRIRRDAHVKLCFPVERIADARARAASLGGGLEPPEREWEARGFRACDGYDPEGNVLQVREAAS